MIRTLLFTVGLSLVFLAVGCSTPTYVNIPQQQGDLARGNPNAEDIRNIMVSAITAAVEHEPLQGAYEVLLPSGTEQLTYEDVVLRVGGGAISPDTLRDEAVPTVRVAAIRVRNRKAEVDILRPSPTGRSVLTVYLFWYYGAEWQVERVRPLRVSPESILPPEPIDVPVPTPAGMTVPADEPSDDNADAPPVEPGNSESETPEQGMKLEAVSSVDVPDA